MKVKKNNLTKKSFIFSTGLAILLLFLFVPSAALASVGPPVPPTALEWSDITYIEGQYSRIYFDYQNGIFHCINDWIVNQADGKVNGGLKTNEYNRFGFTIGTSNYEIRVYPDGQGDVFLDGNPGNLPNFKSATSWTTSPNEPNIPHTVWEFSFEVPPIVMGSFTPKDPSGPAVPVFTNPPPPSIVSTGPSRYSHHVDGEFSDVPLPLALPPVPRRAYQAPVPDPAHPADGFRIVLNKDGGIIADAVGRSEWSDITYIEGRYSRIYFDYRNGTFYCINDWIVNQADGAVNGGLNTDEYNSFAFTLGTNKYEIRIYPDHGKVFRDGKPGDYLPNFQSATSWTTSPNEPNIPHTIWEFSFEVPPTIMGGFIPGDPKGGAVPVFTPPPPSIVSTGPSRYPHHVDGEFSDVPLPPALPPVPRRAYQAPVPDPAHPAGGFAIVLNKEGGIIADAVGRSEWSDIKYIEGQYSRIYFDYRNGTFYCINDWVVNQADGAVNGGLKPDEYNRFAFTLGASNYEIRVYPDGQGEVLLNGKPGNLWNFQSATSWTTSPNEPKIPHTIWEFSFDVPPNIMVGFNPEDPAGTAVPVFPPPAPSIVSTGPSQYPHYIDGEFADLPIPPHRPPVPARDYQNPVPDPAHPDNGFAIVLNKDGGIIADAVGRSEWSDIKYIEGRYSRIYFDYCYGRFHCINDWIVNQADGAVNGGLNSDEYNRFAFTLGTSNYEIRIYPDGQGEVLLNGKPGNLWNFQSATSWTTSPNEPNIPHTIWEFSFDTPPIVIGSFRPCDPSGPAKPVFGAPPPPSMVSTGPSQYPHYVDGEFSFDAIIPPTLPPLPARDYQEPVPDPAHPLEGFRIILNEEGGVIAGAVGCEGEVIPPVAICQDITVQLDERGRVCTTADQIDAGSYDNCGIASMAVKPDCFTCDNSGENTVTLIVTDTNGNTSECRATVTVQDVTPPVAVCRDITVPLDERGMVCITADQIDAGSYDNCGRVSMAVEPDCFTCGLSTCQNLGNNSVTLIVTDASGNTSTCEATVTVQDVTPPVAICRDITLQLDGPGDSCISEYQVDAGSYDNCGIADISLDRYCFNSEDVGEQTVTLTVSDINGNLNFCPAVVTVVGVSGDLNGDGLVDMVDVMMCVNIILKIDPYTDSADLNGDGFVNVIDLQMIIGIILGPIPVE